MEIPPPDVMETGLSMALPQTESISTAASYTSSRTFSVKIPVSDFNESILEVRASVLNDVRKKIQSISSGKLEWLLEVVLMAAGLFWGGWISYLQSNGSYSKVEQFIYGTLFFSLALTKTVVFGILKYINWSNTSVTKEQLLELIPDPQKALNKE